MLVSFARQTLQVVRPGVANDHGNISEDWSSVTVHPVAGCLVDTAPGGTDSQHRDAIRTDLTVLMPPGTDVKGSDHIRVPGYTRDFEIVDGPRFQGSPTGALDQVQLGLNVVEG